MGSIEYPVVLPKRRFDMKRSGNKLKIAEVRMITIVSLFLKP